MRTSGLVLALIVGLGLGAIAVLPTTAAEKATTEQIGKLIEQLGSTNFADREQASRLLDAVGPPALDALRKAAQSNDVEVRRRASELVQKIEKRGENAQLLAPKRVHLVCKDTPVAEAIADLAKKSGYDIALHDPQKQLAARKVTVDTGDVSFWEAFDKFCVAANLVEATPQDLVPVRPPNPGRPPIRQPVPLPAPVPPAPPAPAPQPNQNNQAAVGNAGVIVAVAQVQGGQGAPGAAPAGQAQGAPAIAIAPQPGIAAPPVPGRIVLKDGKSENLPTDYAGAVRVRALSKKAAAPRGAAEINLMLEAAPEPKLRWQNVINVRVEKAIDDRGQNLQVMAEENPAADPNVPVAAIAANAFVARVPVQRGANHPVAPVRLKKGNGDVKMLKQLEGVLSAQVWAEPKAMLTVEDVFQAAGKTIKGNDGGFIKVVEAKREANGQIVVRMEMEMPPNVLPAGQPQFGGGFGGVIDGGGVIRPLPIQIQPVPVPVPPKAPNGLQFQPAQAQPVQVQIQIAPAVELVPRFGGGMAGLTLVDEKGQSVQPSAARQQARRNGNTVTVEHQLTFPAAKGEKAKLVFSASKSASVDIPFKLKDVPLP